MDEIMKCGCKIVDLSDQNHMEEAYTRAHEIGELRAERDALRRTVATLVEGLKDLNQSKESELNALRAKADIPKWVCFHCGFESIDPKEAASHFGDRYDEQPMCFFWADLDADGKLTQHQSLQQELDREREENAAYRIKVEGLEYRVEGQLGEIHSHAPFRKCSTINEIFNLFDSMEGSALAAGVERDALRAEKHILVKALGKIADCQHDARKCHVIAMNAIAAVAKTKEKKNG